MINEGPQAVSKQGCTVGVITCDLDLVIYSYHGDTINCLETVSVKDLVPKEIGKFFNIRCGVAP